MENNIVIEDSLFCCLSQEQQEEIKQDVENNNYKTVYYYQKNFTKEKTGYRCSVCGKFYPFLYIKDKDERIAPEDISKLKGELKKYKKASTVFCGDHYYAQNKKTLLKFQMDAEQNMMQTDEIPIMGDVYHVIISQDEKYIATETFKGTIAIIDVGSKQMIAKKLKCDINGSFIFSEDNQSLLYYFKDAIRCWNFNEKKEEIIWNVPEEWKVSGEEKREIHVVCNNVIYNPIKNTYLFQCMAGKITYVVIIKDNVLHEVINLPEAPILSRLVYVEERNQYTLFAENDFFYNTEAFLEKCKDLPRVYVYMTHRVSEVHGFALVEKGKLIRLFSYDEDEIKNIGKPLPEEIALGYHLPKNFEEEWDKDGNFTSVDEVMLVELAIQQVGIDVDEYPYKDVKIGKMYRNL